MMNMAKEFYVKVCANVYKQISGLFTLNLVDVSKEFMNSRKKEKKMSLFDKLNNFPFKLAYLLHY